MRSCTMRREASYQTSVSSLRSNAYSDIDGITSNRSLIEKVVNGRISMSAQPLKEL
jgi:hypothetical protein